MSLAKPQMRRLLGTQITRNIYIAGILGVITSIAWKYGVLEKRKEKYAEFHRNYDIDADFERMRKLGLFQSCSADD